MGAGPAPGTAAGPVRLIAGKSRNSGPTHRCRLCTANDREALVEQVAEQLRERRRHGTLDDWPWAGGYWQPLYRELAATAVKSLGG